MDGQSLLPGFDEIIEVAVWDGISPEEARVISGAARAAFERRDDVSWMEDYVELIREGWPWRVACYIAWATTPRAVRLPKTMGELASVLGLSSARTIRAWREKNAAIDERVRGMIVAPLMAARADIIEALIGSATTADHKNHPDRRLALEMAKLYTPKQEVDATVRQARVFLPELEPLPAGDDDGGLDA